MHLIRLFLRDIFTAKENLMEKSKGNRPKIILKREIKEKSNIKWNDNSTGMLKEPLNVLASMQLSNCPQICALIIHEKILNQNNEKYNDKTYKGGLTKNNEALLQEKEKKAVILMVVSLEENWKIPTGILFVDSSSYTAILADTIKDTLRQLKDIGIHIVCVSMDCLVDSNLVLAANLGWKIDINSVTSTIKPYFEHPHCGTISIYFQLSSLIDNLKDYWASNITLCHKDDVIDYDLVEYAKKININNLPKHTSQISNDWTIIKKRLKYDEEDISETVAHALTYLMQIQHPDFKTAQPTITFIRILEFVQSLVDETRIDQLEVCSMNPDYEDHWKPLFVKYNHYLRNLKKMTIATPSHLSTFNIYVTGIRASLHSLLHIYTEHICIKNKIKEANPMISLPSRLDTSNISIMISDILPTALITYKHITSLATRTHLIKEMI
ncbi:uncharacterized protein LOC143202698 [Rhynchophorus ferrugineus]|uniref:Uncharacterized protein n=1 Tax=Rhynchophorus ferrugineus TaxID=354439 RepID=A0A834MFD5_RHYFE|nr:hypothetical protein GWI33_002898 [Rhynchophorus ferrugineus]